MKATLKAQTDGRRTRKLPGSAKNGRPSADNRGMAMPATSPAYQQIQDWYQHWHTMEMAQPQKMLVTTGAPDEVDNGPTETDPGTQTFDITA